MPDAEVCMAGAELARLKQAPSITTDDRTKWIIYCIDPISPSLIFLTRYVVQ